MAKKKKHKTGIITTGYVEKVSSQIFDKYQKEITNMIKGYLKSSKKLLPILKKQVKNKIQEELETSFRVTPSDEIKRGKKTKIKGKGGGRRKRRKV